MMRYAEYAPSPRFRHLVERFWFLESRGTGTADAVFPDGRMELVFHYRGSFWRHQPGVDDATGAPTELVKQPASLLVGQMVEPVVLSPGVDLAVAAIRLRPGAARALLGFSLDELAGRFLDLELVFPSASVLHERLPEASSDAARLEVLEEWLRPLACRSPRRDIEASVATVLRSGGRATIETLASLTGTGVRQLERQFREEVGLAPKTFSRIVRLQGALRRIREGLPLSEVAAACGYYDQAHMTRDFRQLAAMSPGVWQQHAGDLAPLFVTPSFQLDRQA
jgi:AraC-like DNA-binding protein